MTDTGNSMNSTPPPPARPQLGVVVVTYNSGPVILGCLESLMAARDTVDLHIVVVDNGSTDDTLDVIQTWAAGTRAPDLPSLPFDLTPCPKPVQVTNGTPETTGDGADPDGLVLLATGVNAGFAGGVNRGVAHLSARYPAERIWILNPDGIAAPGCVHAFATHDPGPFSLMGGRVNYLETPDVIQIDGGVINRRTGITNNVHQGANHTTTPDPDPATFDFITGASMVASPAFVAQAGPMAEDYFLYYEEVDWALQRGDMALAYCPGALIYHWAGSAIGSPKPGQVASPFSFYFKHRGRMMFVRRHLSWTARVTAMGYTWAKAGQLFAQGCAAQGRAMLKGAYGQAPGAEIRARLSDNALARLSKPPPPAGKP